MPNTEEYQFGGFSAPTYTMVPDQIFDELLGVLTGNELKVLLYIVRRTFGFRKDSDAISLNQFSDGIVKHDGTVLDSGAGVSKRGAAEALKGLVAKGIIEAAGQVDEQGGYTSTVYRLCFNRVAPPPIAKSAIGGAKADSATGDPIANSAIGYSRNYHRAIADSATPLWQNLLPQQTVIQETVIQHDHDHAYASVDGDETTPTYSPWIAQVVIDHATELGDKGNGAASVDRALRLWQRSGLPETGFVELLHHARTATRKAQGTRGGVANKVARYMSELDRLIGEAGAQA